MQRALEMMVVEGIKTTIPLHQKIMADEKFQKGDFSTKFMEEFSAAGFAEYLGVIRSTIEEGQRAGVFRAELNAKVAAKILFGALDEMDTNWILSKRRYKLPPMIDTVLDIFLNGVSVK